MPHRETMSSVDRSWLLMDRPTNRMVINGVWILPTRVDFARLEHTLAERLLGFRRFRQRAVESGGRAFWEDDPHFDIRTHVRRIALPHPGDQGALETLISGLVSDPLDTCKALWEFYLIENYQGGSVVLGRIHHCIADGVALVQVMLSLTDPTPESAWQAPASRSRQRRAWNPLRSVIRTAANIVNTATALGGAVLSEGLEIINNPALLAQMAETGGRMAGKTADVLSKLLMMMPDTRTVFRGELGVTKCVAWSDAIPLDDVKYVKNRMGATVNDVLMAALAGGLRRYMIERGESPAGKEIRAMLPVNVRGVDKEIEMGNQFALVYLTLPVSIEDPLDRLFEIKRRMDAIKQSPEALVTYQVINGLGMAPGDVATGVIEYFASKASTVLTNVPGPQQKLYFAGSLIDKMIFWVPQSGSIGMGLSILSYGGEVTVGVITDDKLVPDPQGLVDGFHAEFEQLLALAHLPDIETSVAAAAVPLPQDDLPVVRPERTVDAVADHLMEQFLALKEAAGVDSTDLEPTRCHAQTQSGQRCKRNSQAGSHYCYLHQPGQL